MKLQFQVVAMVAITFVCSLSVNQPARGQQPTTTTVPPKLKAEAKAENVTIDDSDVGVFALRNVAASDMQTTLRDVYGADENLVVSVQPQTNQLIVVGSTASIEKVSALIKTLDTTSPEPVLQMLPSDVSMTVSKDLAASVAQAAQVDLAYDDKLGVMMVRSDSKDRVQRFIEVLDELNSQIQGQSKVTDREVLIRVSWLHPSDKTDVNIAAPDASLKEAIDKLSSMGYSDLVVSGQLMTRCSINTSSRNSTPEFDAEGSTPEGFSFGVSGHFMGHNTGGMDSIDVGMSLNVKRASKSEGTNECSLSVVLQLREGKPIILGSAPVAGGQSFFVVQFMAAD